MPLFFSSFTLTYEIWLDNTGACGILLKLPARENYLLMKGVEE
jgi:hypothetical protein